jgi:hypothetical protein
MSEQNQMRQQEKDEGVRCEEEGLSGSQRTQIPLVRTHALHILFLISVYIGKLITPFKDCAIIYINVHIYTLNLIV